MTEETVRPALAHPTGDETILLVEDEEVVRMMLVEMLKFQGYTVFDAGMAETALTLAEEYEMPIQLLVTDMNMPGMSGWDLAKCLRTLHPGLPILFISGHNDHETQRWGKMEQPVDHLYKPFSLEDFLLKAREILDRPKPVRQ
jgi:CheY-like chemotaxis protein